MKSWRPHWGWASLPGLLLVWTLVARHYPDYVLPSPWAVAREGWRWMQDGSLWHHLTASLLEELGGFGAAVVGAVVLGTAAGLWPRFRDLMAPLNSLFMAIPPIAWAPLIVILFGFGYLSIVLVIFIAALFPMVVTIQEGVQGIQADTVRVARTLGARRWQLARHIYLPASLPFLTAALRIGFSQGWRALVAAEMVGASQGIGWMVSMGGQVGNSSQVLLGIAMIGLMAWLMETLVFRRLEQHYQAWRSL